MSNDKPIVNLDLSLFQPILPNNTNFKITNHKLGRGHFSKVYQTCKPMDQSSSSSSSINSEAINIQDELKSIYNRLKEIASMKNEIILDSNCEYAAKILKRYERDVLPHYQGDKPPCFTASEYNAKEATIIKRLSDLGIGAKVHAIYNTDLMNINVVEYSSDVDYYAELRKRNVDVIIMDKYDGTLGNYFRTVSEDNYEKINEEVNNECNRIIEVMHKNGIVHADLKTSNFLYRKNSDGLIEIVIADAGLSFFSHDENIQKGDQMYSYPKFQFYKDGKPCSYIEKN
jgi:tRNA A-37 threonylcarbamoyl transferase component Bud32